MKRVYKISNGSDVCYSTRLVDVFLFFKRFLLVDCKDASFRFDVEVHTLKSERCSAKIDDYVKSLPATMKNFSVCNAGSRCRGLGE